MKYVQLIAYARLLRAMENRLMSKLDDVVASFSTALDDLEGAVSAEMQQLKDAIAAGTGGQAEVDAAADRIQGLIGRVNAVVDTLKSDDPAPPAPAPEPTPEPAPAPEETPAS